MKDLENTNRRSILKKTMMAVPTIMTFAVSDLKAETSGRPRHTPPSRPPRSLR